MVLLAQVWLTPVQVCDEPVLQVCAPPALQVCDFSLQVCVCVADHPLQVCDCAVPVCGHLVLPVSHQMTLSFS